MGLLVLGVLAGCNHTVTADDGSKLTVNSPGNMTVTDKNGNTATVNSSADQMTVQSKDATMHVDKNGFSETDSKGESVQGGTSVSEADLGAPFYPGSTEVPNSGMKATTEKGSTAMSIRTTSDDPSKVIAFYTDKLGKPETNITSGTTSMAMWKKGKSVTTVSVDKGGTAGSSKITVSVATDK